MAPFSQELEPPRIPGRFNTLSYDDRNRLRQATKPPTNTATYRYNGKGERVVKTVSNGLFATVTAFAYDEGGRLLGEYDDAGKMLAEYVYLNEIPVAVIKNATPYYIEVDHLGTPRQVVDSANNAVLWKWELPESAFGANGSDEDPDEDSAPFTLNLRFPGQYFDAGTGLHYNYFRDYEAKTGRYVESDQIGLKGGISTYAYVRSSPLRAVDPRGLEGECPGNGCCTKVKMWVCERPIDAWYGGVVPNHKYICCNGPNSVCYGHQINDLKAGDPIPSEGDPSGTCHEVEVCEELKNKKCNNPVSPRDAGTITWNCRDWAEWDGK